MASWGREVERATVAGHPCLIYAQRPHSVSELLAAGRRWHERELLVQGTRRVTGAKHEHAVAAAAAHLRERGVRRGDTVLLLGFNSIEWVVAFWALQALGAVAALGNAWWSDAEVAEAVALVEPALALTDRDLAVPALGLGALHDLPVAPLRLEPVAEDDVALIMFSSGTTGAAKAVLMSHRSVVANIHNLLVLTGRLPDELPDSHPGTVSMLSVPLFHLAGIQTSITTLLSGGRLVFLEGRFDPGEVLRLIEAERVRVWGSIPTMVSRVLDHPEFCRFDTSSVRSVPMGGAAISPELRERVSAAFTGVKARVGSLYGLTEAGGVLAAGSGADITSRPGAVGRALPVVELAIQEPGPDGVGEIAARTPTMTGGYLRDPEPVTDAEGWIRTGDLGRIDDEGWLYVTGRSKDIIIRGGENIAAATVERALASHPDVVEVAVVALPHADLGEEVGAAVVLRAGATADPSALRLHAVGTLAGHEVPARWWLHPGPLPTSPSGRCCGARCAPSGCPRAANAIHLSTLSRPKRRVSVMAEALPTHVGEGYDIFSPEYRADPAPTWKSVRESGCPVAHTDLWGGSHMLTRFDDIRDAARDPAASIWHLATYDEDRRRLLAEPALVSTAVEELLRAYAPVSVGRIATEDVELHGRCVHAGERVILPFGAANRDPEVFDDPEAVRLDRRRNRHLTFGTGAHRCPGSNLARLELRIALEEWLAVTPHFRLTDPDGVEWSGGQTRGPERVDVEVIA